MNRIDRLTAILIQLQSKSVVKAQDLADRFQISLRTVYRDIRSLEKAGIPLFGEAGVGYSIMEGYRLPPVMFTIEEATALLTAEKLVEKLTDQSTEEKYKSAMYKIKSVLRSAEKDHLEIMDDRIEVLTNQPISVDKNSSNAIQTILKSIAHKKVLTITYFANHNQVETVRNIEPIGVFYSASSWHVIAFCLLRKDYRDFRTDRISHIIETNLTFEKEHPSLKAYLNQITENRDLQQVIIRSAPSIQKYFWEQKYYHGFISQREVDNQIEMTFLTTSLEGFARWFMMFGDQATIVTPKILKGKIKELVSKLMATL